MHALPADGPFSHPALFYWDDQQYVEGTVPFILNGLEAGEPVAVAVPAARHGMLKEQLGRFADAVRFIDMTQAGRNPGRIIPGVLRAFADAQPHGRVWIIGEPIWPQRTDVEYPACAQHEALINAAFHGRAVSILCPYDAAGLDATVLADAHATHPLIIDPGGRRTSPAYDPEGIVARYNQPLAPPPTATAADFGAPELASVRRWATGRARELGLTGSRLQDMELAVAELTTNSVVHGGGSGTLRIWSEGQQVVWEVCDRGRLADPLAGRHPAPAGRPGGRGLLLVQLVADLVRMHTSEHGTTVRCYFTC